MDNNNFLWINSPVPPAYRIEGVRGKSIEVYSDKSVIRTRVTVGSGMQQTTTDIEKVIYYRDCVGIQLKRSGMLLGFLQFDTAAARESGKGALNADENIFVYESQYEMMEKVYNYIISRFDVIKKGTVPVYVSQISSAEEILKFKKLRDAGIVTSAEYETKKEQLLKSSAAMEALKTDDDAETKTNTFNTNRSKSENTYYVRQEDRQTAVVAQPIIMERWKCPDCGAENAHYTMMCSCGFMKKDLPEVQLDTAPVVDNRPWTCPNCGTENPHYTSKCSCGFEKKDLPPVAPVIEEASAPAVDKSPWICPNCKEYNLHYTTMCSCGFEKKNLV